MPRLAALVPVVVAAVAGLAVLRSDAPRHATGDTPREPVDIVSSAPRATTLEELVEASDLVVLAEVVATAEGRAITAGGDPDRGVRTQLAQLRVVQTVAGDPVPSLVLEEEAALLDGTPLRVDGVAPVETGDRGVFFLVGDGPGAGALFAVVGPQGRFLVGDRGLETAAAGDPLADAIVELGGPALVRGIAALRENDPGPSSAAASPPRS